MGWKVKLASRKFWVAVVPAVFAIVNAVFGWQVPVSPEVVVGLAGVLMAYLFGQSWVDKSAVEGQARVVGNEALLQAQAYIRFLESQLEVDAKGGVDGEA